MSETNGAMKHVDIVRMNEALYGSLKYERRRLDGASIYKYHDSAIAGEAFLDFLYENGMTRAVLGKTMERGWATIECIRHDSVNFTRSEIAGGSRSTCMPKIEETMLKFLCPQVAGGVCEFLGELFLLVWKHDDNDTKWPKCIYAFSTSLENDDVSNVLIISSYGNTSATDSEWRNEKVFTFEFNVFKITYH